MSLAPSETIATPSETEDMPVEAGPTDGVSSPLAEIVARSRSTNGRSQPGIMSPSRPGARKATKSNRAPSQPKPRPISAGEVVVGTLAGLNDAGEPLVRHPLDPSRRVTVARSTVPLDASQVEREVVLTFERGDVEKPIVIGVLWKPEADPASESAMPRPIEIRPIVQATLDGERLVLSAEQEVVLKCGKASLTLTRAGKVLIRGTYLLSRSSGVNRIKGGSVQIN